MPKAEAMNYLVTQQAMMQLVWFSCVLGAARGLPWLGTVVGLAFVAWHLSRSGADVRREAMVVLSAGALGAAVDAALLGSGAVAYPAGGSIGGLGPVWMVVLWMAFGATLNVAYRWLYGRRVAAALLGGVFGPLSYWAGSRLGGVTFPSSAEFGLTLLAVAWALAFPALVWMAQRLAAEPLAVPGTAVSERQGRRRLSSRSHDAAPTRIGGRHSGRGGRP